MAKERQSDVHPLFASMDFEVEDKQTPALEEDAEEIDNAVEELLEDQDLPEEGTENVPVPAKKSGVTAATQDDSDLSEMSQDALVALAYQAKGKIAADVVIPKDLELEGLQDLLLAAKVTKESKTEEELVLARSEAVKAKLEEDGVSKQDFAFLAHLKAGGNPAVVARHIELSDYANDALEDEADMLDRVRFAAKLSGQEDKFIEAYIANSLIEEEDIKEADKAAQQTILRVANIEFARDKERMNAEGQAKVKELQAYEATVTQTIEKGFLGLKLNAADKQNLKEYMTKPSIATDIVENGKKVRKLLTPYEVFKLNLPKNSEHDAAFALWGMKGPAGMVNVAVNTGNDKFLAAAAARQDGKGAGSKARVPELEDDGRLLTTMRFE